MADYSEKYNLKIEVNDEKAKAELAQIDALAKRLEKDKATVRVAVSDSKAKEDLTSILALAQKIDNMRVNIRVAVNGDKQVIAQLSAIQKIQKQTSKERIAQAQIEQKAQSQANSLAERTANNNAKRAQTALRDTQRLADIRADREAKLAQKQPVIDNQVAKLQLQQEGQMLRNAQSLINLQNKLANQGNVFTNMGKGLSQISTQLSSISNVANTASTALANMAKPLLLLGGGGALAGITAVTSQLKGAVSYAMEVEQAQNLLKAQGISDKKVASTYKDIRQFSGITPFGIKDMTESVAAINSYVGDIDTATKATKIFGTSLFATGRDASELYSVGVNLGQLYSGAFSKTDFKEVLRNVPTAGQALRDAIGSSNWDDFNLALGDDPNTREIERTGNALEFLMDVMDKYNVKTHALEQANKSLVNKWANTQEAFKNARQDALMTSGAYDKFGKLVDTLGDKLADPAVEKVFTNLFKGAIPLMDNLEKRIANFNIDKFVNSWVRGFDTVKKTVSDVLNNPVVKFGKNTVTKMLGLEGGAENIGADLGKILSKGIQLGVGSISLKGIALGTRGIAGIASVGGSLATMVGKSIGKSSAKRQIANMVGSELSTVIADGVNLGMGKATQQVEQKLAKKSISSKIGGALSNIGGGLFGFGAGLGATGAGTFVMSRSIRDVSDTIKKIGDDMPTDLADLNALNSKIDNFVRWSNELAQINLGGKLGQATATIATTMTVLGGAAIATGNIPMGIALTGAGIITEGIQTLQAFNEKLKIDNISKLADLPAKLDSMPDLDGNEVAGKIRKLDSTVTQIMTALRITKKVEAGQVVGATSTLATNMEVINMAFKPQLTSDIAKTFQNLNTFTAQLDTIGNLQDIGDKAVQGLTNLDSTMEKIMSSPLFTNSGKQIGPKKAGSGTSSIAMPEFGAPSQIAQRMADFKSALEPFEQLDIKGMTESMNKLNQLIQSFQAMPDLGDPAIVTTKMDTVGQVLTKIQMAFKPMAVAGQGTSTELIDTRWMDNMIASVDKVIPIIQKLQTLPEPTDITAKITSVETVLNTIKRAFASGGGDLVDTRWMDNMIASVDKLIPVMQRLSTMPDPATIIPKIDAVNMVLQRLKALSSSVGGDSFTAPNFAPMITQLGQLDTQIQQVASRKGSVDALASSFPPIAKNADTATSSVNRLKSAINALPTSKTITINVNDNATSTLRDIVSLLGSIVDKSVTVTTNKVTKEEKAVGGVVGKTAKFAEGGMVSKMFKNASRSFKQGQDTVHAMLSQGEAVIRRSAVARLGTSFIDNINKGNLQGAYQDLSSRVATNYNRSVANNQTYTNAPNIIQHFHGSQNQGNQFLKQQLKGISNV